MANDDKNEKSITVSSPGRLCLFGEHSDWAAEYGVYRGCCLVIGTDQAMKATVSPSGDFIVETQIPDEYGRSSGRCRRMTCNWNSDTLLAAARDESEFFRYCAGVAYEFKNRLGIKTGLDIRINEMDLPLKKGVSSSAAVCILVAKAFNTVFDLKLFPHELMEMSYLGERLTGSQCGRMDQACIYGNAPVLLVFEKGKSIRIEPVGVEDSIHMFFVDLAGEKDTVTILNGLQANYMQENNLQHALGKDNEHIVRCGFQYIQQGDAKSLGSLMLEAQKIFDGKVAPNCLDQLQSPILHELLSYEAIKPLIYGGKGVGSQGDGTAQFVARSEKDRDQAMRLIESKFSKMKCFPLTISPARTKGS